MRSPGRPMPDSAIPARPRGDEDHVTSHADYVTNLGLRWPLWRTAPAMINTTREL